jgi:hypothetical protein
MQHCWVLSAVFAGTGTQILLENIRIDALKGCLIEGRIDGEVKGVVEPRSCQNITHA